MGDEYLLFTRIRKDRGDCANDIREPLTSWATTYRPPHHTVTILTPVWDETQGIFGEIWPFMILMAMVVVGSTLFLAINAQAAEDFSWENGWTCVPCSGLPRQQ